jgi:hypothetical protein
VQAAGAVIIFVNILQLLATLPAVPAEAGTNIFGTNLLLMWRIEDL